MAERRFQGQPASQGIAIGPLVRIEHNKSSNERHQGSPAEERSALERAIAKSMADLEALAAVASGDGADMLAFQIEMLADPALIEDILPFIAAGEDAAKAWRTGLDGQILTYEAADDDYFRARASDLRDLENRVVKALEGASIELPDLPDGALLLADNLAPSHFLALSSKTLGGIALIRGSRNSHVAILARGRGLPMAIGLADRVNEFVTEGSHAQAILDGDAGLLLLGPTVANLERYKKTMALERIEANRSAAIRGRSAATVDGTRIEVLINIDDPAAVDNETLAAADGVGLLRTEFLLIGRDTLPDEEEHFQVYTDLQRRLNGKPLIIRTLDIGGDKPLPGLDLPKETNPFLGLRGIRLCLERHDLFKPQVRALLRTAAAAAGGPLTSGGALARGGSRAAVGPPQVMLPMVAVQAEIDETRRFFADCLKELKAEGVAAAMPDIGIMVETPAAAIAADSLDADFFSIGSNDLIQYVTAAARDAAGRVASLLDPGHPAIERLIRNVVEEGAMSGRDVSLCGDMASEPLWLPLLLGAGLRKISVAPAALGRVKLALSTIDLGRRVEQP